MWCQIQAYKVLDSSWANTASAGKKRARTRAPFKGKSIAPCPGRTPPASFVGAAQAGPRRTGRSAAGLGAHPAQRSSKKETSDCCWPFCRALLGSNSRSRDPHPPAPPRNAGPAPGGCCPSAGAAPGGDAGAAIRRQDPPPPRVHPRGAAPRAPWDLHVSRSPPALSPLLAGELVEAERLP